MIAAAFRFTRFGLHTRAAAETEKGAFVSGIAPDRIAALNWMISAAVAAIAGILIAPIVPLVAHLLHAVHRARARGGASSAGSNTSSRRWSAGSPSGCSSPR